MLNLTSISVSQEIFESITVKKLSLGWSVFDIDDDDDAVKNNIYIY